MTKRTLQKVATRAKLVEIARGMFEAKGYDATTFRALAAAAGVSTGCYFAYWPSKAAIWTEATGKPAPDFADFLERVSVQCAGFGGHLDELAEDALELRRQIIGR